MRYKIAGWAGILGVVVFVGEAIIGGLQFERYSHVRQFISETYASGTPWSDALRFGGMLPAGVLFAVFAFTSASKLRVPRRGMIGFIAFGVFYGLGTVATAFFPCDFGCDPGQADPTISHIIHFASGMLTYLFTPFCLLLIGLAAKRWPQAAVLSGTFLAGVTVPRPSGWPAGTEPTDHRRRGAGEHRSVLAVPALAQSVHGPYVDHFFRNERPSAFNALRSLGSEPGPMPCSASTSFSPRLANSFSVVIPARSNARLAGAPSFAIQPSFGA